MTYFWVALGGALGSLARFWMGLRLASLLGTGFPWATIAINVIGSFVIGFYGAWSASLGRVPLPDAARIFVMVGLCGGFTTFSSFSLQTVELLQIGAPFRALGNIVLSVGLCLSATMAGIAAAHFPVRG